MPSPVIYHGSSGHKGSWPGGAGGAPSVSVLSRSIWLPAGQWVPFNGVNPSTPPVLEYLNYGAFYGRAVEFEHVTIGPAYAEVSFFLPSNLNTAVALTASLAWSVDMAPMFNVGWDMGLTFESTLGYSGTGPTYSSASLMPVVGEINYTNFLPLPCRFGVVVPLAGSRMYVLSLHRTDGGPVGVARVAGVNINYQVNP